MAAVLSSTTVNAGVSPERKNIHNQTQGSEEYLNYESSISTFLQGQIQEAYNNRKKVSSVHTIWDSSSRFVGINSPVPGQAYYSGSGYIERMYISITCYDVWKSYFTMPVMGIFRNDKLIDTLNGDSPVSVNKYNNYSCQKSLASLNPGTYEFWVFAAPCYSSGSLVSGWNTWTNIPYASVTFKVRELNPPKWLSAKAKYGYVDINFEKVKGAEKYLIYRSTSKNGSFKKVGTASTNSYKDKTVRRGKKYYYRIRSCRISDVRSKYSKTSSKVKVNY